MVLSQEIARLIEQMLEEAHGELSIGRNELADRFGCVPSQINYVITSRFTPERGYLVESRRGGGGLLYLGLNGRGFLCGGGLLCLGLDGRGFLRGRGLDGRSLLCGGLFPCGNCGGLFRRNGFARCSLSGLFQIGSAFPLLGRSSGFRGLADGGSRCLFLFRIIFHRKKDPGDLFSCIGLLY